MTRALPCLLAGALALGAGCFDPQFREGIGCSPINHECPTGMSCVDSDAGPICVNDENARDASPPLGATRQRISAGEDHSCFIDPMGRLFCWGKNAEAQLGSGLGFTRPQPPTLVAVADGPFVEVSAGPSHTCAVEASGDLWCFGSNSVHKLGVPDEAVTEARVPGTWREVAVGYAHTCAIDDAGDLFCWGFNEQGQTGQPLPNAVDAPTRVAGGPWRDVTAGYAHTCALDTDSHLSCFGYNDTGQLGDGTLMTRDVPRPVNGDLTWQQVAAGSTQTCGISGGRLFCWGGGPSVGFSDGSSMEPVQVGVESDWTFVGTGAFHTCAVRGSEHGRYCFGYNSFGQIGDDTTDQRNIPPSAPFDTDWAQIDGGTYHTCGFRYDGTVACWGGNEFGQTADPPAQSPQPVTTTAPAGDWQAIAAGGDYSSAHTCALLQGEIWCWGSNDHGQLGIGPTPTQVMRPVQLALGGGWSDVKTGAYHTCARKGTELWCWGKNDFGETGSQNGGTDVTTPFQVPGTFADFALGSFHTCALETDATLLCWGKNEQGQLGLGFSSSSEAPTSVPPPVTPDAFWTRRVFAGALHTCALLNDSGTTFDHIWCWGQNAHGEVGNPSTTVDQNRPYQLSWGPDDADGGDEHTCMTHFGTALCFGADDGGQLGRNTAGADPVAVAHDFTNGGIDTGAVQISAGIMHTCTVAVTTTTQDLWCWGSNQFGQLGYADPRDGSFMPAQVDLGGEVVNRVGAGPLHTCAITGSEGSSVIRCWGSNAYGQLGNDRAWVGVPTQMIIPP